MHWYVSINGIIHESGTYVHQASSPLTIRGMILQVWTTDDERKIEIYFDITIELDDGKI